MQVIGAAGTRGPLAASPAGVDSVQGRGSVRDVVRTAVCAQMGSSSRLTSVINSPVMVGSLTYNKQTGLLSPCMLKDRFIRQSGQ